MAALGVFSVLLLAAAVAWRAPAAVAWAVALCGSEYGVFLALRGRSVDRWAPLVAAALFLAAELAFRATESARSAPERAIVLRGGLWLAAGVAGTAALGAVLLAAAGGTPAGVGLEALGVAAAVLTLAVLVGLVARTRDSS